MCLFLPALLYTAMYTPGLVVPEISNVFMSSVCQNENTSSNSDYSEIEQLLFQSHKCLMTFFIEPSFSGASGLCIFKNSKGQYVLQIKKITNFKGVDSLLNEKFPLRGLGDGDDWKDPVKGQEILLHNQSMLAQHNKERLKRYQISTSNIIVSDAFVENLINKILYIINSTIVPIDEPNANIVKIVVDGTMFTIRCNIGGSVSVLKFHDSESIALKSVEPLVQMVNDASFNEMKYSKFIKL